MASREIDVRFKTGGAEYLHSLERLGLRPDALFWAFDKTVDKFVLVLVTDEYDYAGPFALSKTLIEAYNKAKTPIEIEPFIVRMHSPWQPIIQEMGKFLPFRAEVKQISNPDGTVIEGLTAKFASLNIQVADLEIEDEWIYRFEKPPKRKTVELSRRWRRFAENVAKAA